MKLTDKHLENLQALVEAPDEGILRSETPHPRHLQALVKADLAEVCGETWIARVTVTDKGRYALDEWSQTHD